MKRHWWFLAASFLLLITLSQTVSAAGGLVALQTADPSCADDSGNIYVDCGNGTVTDNRTGLVWLKNAGCVSDLTGSGADFQSLIFFVQGLSDLPDDPGSNYYGEDCGLEDGSSPGEWRLPSVAEMEAMIADAMGEGGDPDCTQSPPTITNDSGLGCWISGPSSFINVKNHYLTSTSSPEVVIFYFGINLTNGTFALQSSPSYIWPVRGGQ